MSVTVLRRVIENSSATGGARLLLLVLAEHADDNGKCWPSVGTLARECRCSKRYVTANLRALESSGDITTEQKTGNRSTYFVTTKILNDSSPLKNGSVLNDSSQPMNHSSATPELSFTQTVKNRNEPSNPPIVPPMENDDGDKDEDGDSLDIGPGEGKPGKPDKPKAKTGSPGVKRRIAEDRQPDHAAIAYAKQHGVDVHREWPKFVNHWIDRDAKTERGWAAAWRNWCLRSLEYAERDKRMAGPARTGKPSDWIEAFAMAEREANGVQAATRAAGLWGDDEGDLDSTGQVVPFGRIGRA